MSKPFDLEAAKRGEPIQTRDGTPAKFVAYEPGVAPGNCSVIVLANGYLTMRYADGASRSDRQPSDADLVMAPRKRTVWVNFYQGNRASWWDSDEVANGCGTGYRIGNRAWPVEIEE